MAKTSTPLEQAFEPVRKGLKRTLVESEDRGLRETALSYLDATDTLIEISGPGGGLTKSGRSELLTHLKTHGASVGKQVLAENWPVVLDVAYKVLAAPPGAPTAYVAVLKPPPGGTDPDSYRDTPGDLPEDLPNTKAKPARKRSKRSR